MYTQSVHQLAAAGLTFAASMNTAYALAVPHVLDPRAPHFAEVMVPEPDFVLRANGSSLNDTVAFQYRNGERAWDTTMTVSLVNGNQTYLLASNVTFYNSWYVNATLNIVYDQVPDGNYTLLAAEILDGDVYNEVAQPFGISHDPNSAPPTGSMTDVDLSSASTSAYVVQSDGVTSFFPSSSSSNWYDTPSQQTSAPAAAVGTASVPSSAKVDVNNSIEDALRELAEAVEGA